MGSVLIVDDDIDLLEMVSLVLYRHGMKVHCLSKGSFLFSSIIELNPDLILMDIYLNDTDGRSLCYSLKTSEKFQHIPVILYSAGAITQASIKGSLANHFFVKPFNIAELIDKINVLIQQRN